MEPNVERKVKKWETLMLQMVLPGLVVEEDEKISAVITCIYAVIYVGVAMVGARGYIVSRFEPQCEDVMSALFYGGLVLLGLTLLIGTRFVLTCAKFANRSGLDISFLHMLSFGYMIYLFDTLVRASRHNFASVLGCNRAWVSAYFGMASIQIIYSLAILVCAVLLLLFLLIRKGCKQCRGMRKRGSNYKRVEAELDPEANEIVFEIHDSTKDDGANNKSE